MNNRATGIAIHAIITNPIETIAPARVPGTDTFPNALSATGLGPSVFGRVNNYSTFRQSAKDLPALGHQIQYEPHLPRPARRREAEEDRYQFRPPTGSRLALL